MAVGSAGGFVLLFYVKTLSIEYCHAETQLTCRVSTVTGPQGGVGVEV